MSVLMTRDEGGPNSPSLVNTGTDLWADSFPGIWEVLSAPLDPSGKPRVGGTLTLFISDGYVKLCCNERHVAKTCFVTALSVGQALEALEKGLQGGTLDWRTVKAWKPKK